MKAANLANGNSKDDRRESDFYPTPPEVTHALMKFLKLDVSVVWEPACGDGHMSEVIKSYGHQVVSTDLRNTTYGNGGCDFLTTNLQCDAIITNPPPFHIADKFIEHAVPKAYTVAMLVKSQYWHAAKRIALYRDLPPAYILPLTWRPDFRFDQRVAGEKANPLMDVMWVVWRWFETDAKYIPLARP